LTKLLDQRRLKSVDLDRQPAAECAEAVRPAITETAHLAARAAAGELGVKTANGKLWHSMQIIRMRDRLGL
jgi:hypothetical protein